MRSLDRCEVCQAGRMMVYKSKSLGARRLKYLKCSSCGSTGKEWIRLDSLGRQSFELDTSSGKQVVEPVGGDVTIQA